MGAKRTPAASEQLKRAIFILLLVFLPSQLGLHFWPEWAFINGVRIDYFSPTLYFTDILILLLLLLEISNFKFLISKKCLILGLFILANVYFSPSPFVVIYKWLKVAEFGFLAYWIAKNFKPEFTKWLLVPITYSCILAIMQFFNQGSIGGVWYWLGERTFNSSTPGIAPGRPYATSPHPNVLTGFLVVSGLVVLRFFPRISRKITALVIILVVLVLLLTPSRGDLLNGFRLRQQLNNIAITQWTRSPIVGTGLGTSPFYPRNISNYALLHQPIHNVFFLLLSETGVVGLGLFLILVFKTWHWLWLPILFLGLFDHYFLTLQQGQLLLALVIGIIIACRYQKGLPQTLSPKSSGK